MSEHALYDEGPSRDCFLHAALGLDWLMRYLLSSNLGLILHHLPMDEAQSHWFVTHLSV